MKKSLKSCHLISARQFARWFHCPVDRLSRECVARLKSADTPIRAPTSREREEYIIRFIDLIRSGRIVRNEAQNRIAWEQGWRQNLNALKKGLPIEQAIKPGYFRGSKYLRLENDLVISPNPNLEHELFAAARLHLFNTYLKPYPNIVEIGCGSGQNLWMLAKLFPEKRIFGLDWVESSVTLANGLGRRCQGRIKGIKFDMVHPDSSLRLPDDCAVMTIHAMEQIGHKHHALLGYLMDQAPLRVIHYEPIVEFYDLQNVFDYLAAWYCKRRRYLCGYLPALQRMAAYRRIRIVDAFRPYLGGELHESSVIVWQPQEGAHRHKRKVL